MVNYKPGDAELTTLAIDEVKDEDNDLRKRIKKVYEFVANYINYDDDKVALAKQQSRTYKFVDGNN
ncbi:MAG: hypothetical protein V8R63_11755 [Thomasclavelia ramosa]